MISPERQDKTGEVIDKELSRIDHELLVKKYQPKFLGTGGEQVVFSLPGHDATVVKVHKHILGKSISDNMKEDKPFGHESEGFEERKNKMLNRERRANRDLKKYFGKSALQERPYAMKVPITKALLKAADQEYLVDRFPDGVHYAYTLVRIQEKAPKEATADTAVTSAFQYKEAEILDTAGMALYEDMNSALIDGRGEVTEEIEIAVGGLLRDLTNQMREDEGLKDAVKDFIEKAILYSSETGEMLDLAGPGNVSFYQKDGKWQYVLIDAKYPERDSFTAAQEAFQKFEKGEELKMSEKNRLLNVLNYVRSVNMLATVSGSSEKLKLTDHNIAGQSREIYRTIHRVANF